MEKAMAPHSSTLAWKIPWMEEPGRLQSMGSLRVGHAWATSLSLFTFMHWRRKWQSTPVFLPGESQGQGSLVGCRRTQLKWLSSSSSICLCIYLCIRLSMYPSMYLCICLSMYPSIYVSMYLSMYLCIHLCMYVFIYHLSAHFLSFQLEWKI